jgi:hypothetical protein
MFTARQLLKNEMSAEISRQLPDISQFTENPGIIYPPQNLHNVKASDFYFNDLDLSVLSEDDRDVSQDIDQAYHQIQL